MRYLLGGILTLGTGKVAVTTSEFPCVFTRAPASHRYRTFTSEISFDFVASGMVS